MIVDLNPQPASYSVLNYPPAFLARNYINLAWFTGSQIGVVAEPITVTAPTKLTYVSFIGEITNFAGGCGADTALFDRSWCVNISSDTPGNPLLSQLQSSATNADPTFGNVAQNCFGPGTRSVSVTLLDNAQFFGSCGKIAQVEISGLDLDITAPGNYYLTLAPESQFQSEIYLFMRPEVSAPRSMAFGVWLSEGPFELSQFGLIRESGIDAAWVNNDNTTLHAKGVLLP